MKIYLKRNELNDTLLELIDDYEEDFGRYEKDYFILHFYKPLDNRCNISLRLTDRYYRLENYLVITLDYDYYCEINKKFQRDKKLEQLGI